MPRILGMPLLPAAALRFWRLACRGSVARRARRRAPAEDRGAAAGGGRLLGRALRAGHSFSQRAADGRRRTAGAAQRRIQIAHEEINYGVPMNEASTTWRAHSADRSALPGDRGADPARIGRQPGRDVWQHQPHHPRSPEAAGASARAVGRGPHVGLDTGPAAAFACMVDGLSNPKYVRVLWTDPTGVRLMWYAFAMMPWAACCGCAS
jgi:tight adherence protein B